MITESQNNIIHPKLICEANYWHQSSLEEIASNRKAHNGYLVMTSCLQRANKKNQMGRIYPRHILEREFQAYQKLVDTNSAYCELDHPDAAVVSYKSVCGRIIKQWNTVSPEGHWEWWGDILISNNRLGKDTQCLIEEGGRISISSRGVGTTERDRDMDADVVQPNLVMIAFDLVTQPSTHDANLIVKESYLPEAKDLYKNEYAYHRYMQNSAGMILQQEGKNNPTKEVLESKIKMLIEMDWKNRGVILA